MTARLTKLTITIGQRPWRKYSWTSKLIRGVRRDLLAYVVWQHIKVSCISPGYAAYLNLDKEMITRAPILEKRLDFNLSQESFDRVYFDYQCNTFKIDNALMYQNLLKKYSWILMHMIKWSKEWVCRMVKHCILMPTNDFLALNMSPGRLQNEKENCKLFTIMVREKGGIWTSMLYSTRNIISLWRAL